MWYGKFLLLLLTTKKSFLHSAQIMARHLTPDNLSEDTVFSGRPQISSQGNDVYVVWVGGTFGNFETFFVVSTDNGQTFNTPDNLSENTGDSRDAQISSSGNNVYVVWKSDNDIFFAFSTDNGLTFSFPDNLSEGIWR